MRTVYHKQLGMTVYPGMVSGGSAHFIHGIQQTEGVGNGAWEQIPVGSWVQHSKLASTNHAFTIYPAPNPGAAGGFASIPAGVIVYSPLVDYTYKPMPEPSTTEMKDVPVMMLPHYTMTNIITFGKVWCISERQKVTAPPMTPIKVYNGILREVNSSAGVAVPGCFFTGTPCVEYIPGKLWLHEIMVDIF